MIMTNAGNLTCASVVIGKDVVQHALDLKALAPFITKFSSIRMWATFKGDLHRKRLGQTSHAIN